MPQYYRVIANTDQYEQIATAIPSEIEENYKSYCESYKKPMPFYIGVPQIDNGKLRLNWDAAYDFEARDIRYTVELARDYAISDVLFKAEDVLLPVVTCYRRRQAVRHEVFLRAGRR